ncbi:MAG: hypothetical protein Q7V57_12355 [Actinomycetota bacterium]|nr:hypothetical protein [Actinomycetota bacterium]
MSENEHVVVATTRVDWREWVAVVGAWAMGALVFFRDSVFSGFDHIIGDIGDARLIAVLHEHWLEVFRGRQPWRTPNFFHPVDTTLGYSDTFLLNQVLYTPLRVIGLDRYAALQWTIILAGLIGFVAFYIVCTRLLHGGRWMSIALAATFVFANNFAVQSSHVQLYSVHWVPVAVLLVAKARVSRTTRSRVAWSFGAGAFLGLLVYSTYYVGWFTVFATVLFGLRMLVHLRDRISTQRIRELADRLWRPLAGFAGGFALTMIPFALTYLPKLDETGGRPLDQVIAGAPGLADAVNLGPDNYLWGARMRWLFGQQHRLNNVEVSDAITPLLMLTLFVCVVLVAVMRRRDRSTGAATARALLTVAVLLMVLPLRRGDFSLWRAVWTYVPGAQALRAIGRLELMVSLLAPLAIAASVVVLRPSGERTGRRRWPMALAAVWLVLPIEQLNLRTITAIDRSDEMAFINGIPAAPEDCEAFFIVVPQYTPDFVANIDAMIVAQMTGVPTVNGYSGAAPPFWDLNPSNETYLDSVQRWNTNHGVGATCAYDRAANTWDSDPFD